MPKNYQVLDTYNAELFNELVPRREQVSEIQDREEGDLLCYANPAHAQEICDALNKGPCLDLSCLGKSVALEVLRGFEQGVRINALYIRRAIECPRLYVGPLNISQLRKELANYETFLAKIEALIINLQKTP